MKQCSFDSSGFLVTIGNAESLCLGMLDSTVEVKMALQEMHTELLP